MKYTSDIIHELRPDQIIVFGSNTEGRHGKGLAKICLEKFGAKYGQPKGIQGQSYAIITKDLSKGLRSVSLAFITEQITELYQWAEAHPWYEVLFTKIGTGLGGFSEREISHAIKAAGVRPPNVVLPKFGSIK